MIAFKPKGLRWRKKAFRREKHIEKHRRMKDRMKSGCHTGGDQKEAFKNREALSSSSTMATKPTKILFKMT